MRLIHFTFALLLAAFALPLAMAADGASVRAVLITATNLKRESDPKLAEFEAELQRNLPLSSFRYVGESAASVPAGGRTTVSLPRGHRLEIDSERGGGRGIRIKVQWLNGNTVVFNTGLTLQPGVPAVLGRRPSGDGETPIVILIAR